MDTRWRKKSESNQQSRWQSKIVTLKQRHWKVVFIWNRATFDKISALNPDYIPLCISDLEIFSWITVYTNWSRVAISEAIMFMGVLHACSLTHCSILGKLLFTTLGKLSQSRMMYLRILASSGSVRFNPQTKKPAGCEIEQKLNKIRNLKIWTAPQHQAVTELNWENYFSIALFCKKWL